MAHRKLYRSDTDKVFAGVVGGIGEHFDVDATLLRLAWVVFVIFTGLFPGVFAYIVAAIIIPKRPASSSGKE